MWNNAVATREVVCDGQSERYLARSLDVYKRLEQMTKEQLPHVDLIRHAIEFGIGATSARMGLASATEWAELLEQDSLHQINALYLRKAIRLQAGDWEGAEGFRKKAEILALRARMRQMFDSTLTLELSVHAMAHDLTGLKQVRDRIELRAARSPGWVPYLHIAEGHFQRICGNLEQARAAFERALLLSAPDPHDPSRMVAAFPTAMAGLVSSLVDLGLAEQAELEGKRALEVCAAHDIQAHAHPLVLALSLAEAKLGEHAAASERLGHVIEAQTKLGVTGLLLGATYEARARVAIWAGDEPAVETYGRLTAIEYRHGLGSPLGARYERLMDEARRSVALTLPKLWHFESTQMAKSRESATAMVTQLLRGAETAKDRAARVLQLLCSGRASNEGHLYLCGEDGPTLIASQGAEEPPGGLLGYVQNQLTRELEAGNSETAVLTELTARSSECPLIFTDAAGRTHRPIFLTAVVNELARYAAIAVVIDTEDRATDFALATALAGHLIEAGDTMGVAAGDG
jgi:tetratricopeptide (TPR) repeat protein